MSTANVVLWVVQVLVALAFAQHGWSFLFRLEETRKRLPYARDLARPLAAFVGMAEIAGAVGVIVPAATSVLPWLTWLAASGLVVIMALAAIWHVTRREWPNLVFNLILGALAFVVAYGRAVVAPV